MEEGLGRRELALGAGLAHATKALSFLVRSLDLGVSWLLLSVLALPARRLESSGHSSVISNYAVVGRQVFAWVHLEPRDLSTSL